MVFYLFLSALLVSYRESKEISDYRDILPAHHYLSVIIDSTFLHRKKEGKVKLSSSRKLIVSISVLLVGLLIAVGTVKSGYHAKVHGCNSCHNASMGGWHGHAAT